MKRILLAVILLGVLMVGSGQDLQQTGAGPTVLTSKDGESITVSCQKGQDLLVASGEESTSFIESHIPMTALELREWELATGKSRLAGLEEKNLQKKIIKAHHLQAIEGCGEQIDIRSDESFIFDSVPDNPKWKGWAGDGVDCGERLRAKREVAKWLADGKPAPKAKK